MASTYHSAASADSGRDLAESHDDPEGLLLDEMSSDLVSRGCPPALAPALASGVLDVIRQSGARVADILGIQPPSAAAPDERERQETLYRCSLRDIVAAGDKAAMIANCDLIARGDGLDDHDSMRRAAKRHGVTVEAISKRVAQRQSLYRLPPNRHQKSPDAVDRYRLTNKPNFSNAKEQSAA